MDDIKRLNPVSFSIKLLVFFVIMLVVCFIGLMIGSVGISFDKLLNVFFSNNYSDPAYQIIFDIRLPRILLAVAVGGGLSVAGAVFQAILINPLAEPYILGVSSGGTFGAVLSFIIGISFLGTQFFAFAGSLAVIFVVFMLGRRFGEMEPNVLLLTGVMVGAFFSAAILMMMSLLNDSLRTAVFWLIGNLSLADKSSVKYVLPVVFVVSLILSLNANKYNILSLGSETAKQFGIDSKFLRNVTYILASLMVGSIVSVSGIVGFVGLIVPHVCRMIFGYDNRIVIPVSFFIGASYLTLADTISRVIISPAELPVGAVTALIGAPVFIFLLKKRFQYFGG
jgi:iron complex transport system permease protein